jgi:hypothetical protein
MSRVLGLKHRTENTHRYMKAITASLKPSGGDGGAAAYAPRLSVTNADVEVPGFGPSSATASANSSSGNSAGAARRRPRRALIKNMNLQLHDSPVSSKNSASVESGPENLQSAVDAALPAAGSNILITGNLSGFTDVPCNVG